MYELYFIFWIKYFNLDVIVVQGYFMSFCPNCGAEVDESANFCPECGNKLTSSDGNESESEDIGSEQQEEGEGRFKSGELSDEGRELAQKLRDKGIIGSDEAVLHYAQQSRSESVVRPAKLILTKRQLVYYKSKTFGSNIDSRGLDKIDDISIDGGLMKADMVVRGHGLDNLEFEGFSEDKLQDIRNAIRRVKS